MADRIAMFDESVAATVAFSENQGKAIFGNQGKFTILTYDFGAGTFDYTFMKVDLSKNDNSRFVNVFSDSRVNCGGNDIDHLFRAAIIQYAKVYNIHLKYDIDQSPDFLAECERIKILLSTKYVNEDNPSVTIDLKPYVIEYYPLKEPFNENATFFTNNAFINERDVLKGEKIDYKTTTLTLDKTFLEKAYDKVVKDTLACLDEKISKRNLEKTCKKCDTCKPRKECKKCDECLMCQVNDLCLSCTSCEKCSNNRCTELKCRQCRCVECEKRGKEIH